MSTNSEVSMVSKRHFQSGAGTLRFGIWLLAAGCLAVSLTGCMAKVWEGYDPSDPLDLIFGTPLRLVGTAVALPFDVLTLGGTLSPEESAVFAGQIATAASGETYSTPVAPYRATAATSTNDCERQVVPVINSYQTRIQGATGHLEQCTAMHDMYAAAINEGNRSCSGIPGWPEYRRSIQEQPNTAEECVRRVTMG